MAYLLDILSNSLKIRFLRRCSTKAVSRTVVFKHNVWNSSCWEIQSMFWSFELNKFSYSLQHLHSINVWRMTQLFLHLHQWRFSNLLESKSSSELSEQTFPQLEGIFQFRCCVLWFVSIQCCRCFKRCVIWITRVGINACFTPTFIRTHSPPYQIFCYLLTCLFILNYVRKYVTNKVLQNKPCLIMATVVDWNVANQGVILGVYN